MNVNELAAKLGQLLVNKYNRDIAKAEKAIDSLGIEELSLEQVVVIKTRRPGLVIGKKGEQVNELEKAFGMKIRIEEVHDSWYYHLWDNVQQLDDIDYYYDDDTM